jgi:hypothetical protein
MDSLLLLNRELLLGRPLAMWIDPDPASSTEPRINNRLHKETLRKEEWQGRLSEAPKRGSVL